MSLLVCLEAARADTNQVICNINGKLSVRTKCPRASSTIKDLPGLLGNKALPKGLTLRGFYNANGSIISLSGGGNLVYDTISFGGSLAQVPTAHYIAFNETAPTECPGTVEQPEAAEGHLCVYEDGRTNVSSAAVTTTAGESPAKYGASISATGTSTGLVMVRGTWAVTAP